MNINDAFKTNVNKKGRNYTPVAAVDVTNHFPAVVEENKDDNEELNQEEEDTFNYMYNLTSKPLLKTRNSQVKISMARASMDVTENTASEVNTNDGYSSESVSSLNTNK